jgi:hypothetical protein
MVRLLRARDGGQGAKETIMSRVPKSVIADRSAGTIMASACGDALGAPHEFKPPLNKSVSLAMTGGGSYGWKPGEWTDEPRWPWPS